MKKYIRKILILVCIGILLFVGYKAFDYGMQLYNQKNDNDKLISEVKQMSKAEKIQDEETEEPVEKESDEEEFIPDASTYAALHAQNPDYVGWLKWNSGIISTPVLQGLDDNYYLDHNFYGNYVIGGAAFMDAQTSLTDQNIIIYGHSVFVTETATVNAMFSPLREMLDPSYCNSNKTLQIFWENEIATYEVYAVCNIDTSSDDWTYEQNVFSSDEEFYSWKEHADANNTFTPLVSIGPEDRLVTFQTCLTRTGPNRVVIIAKELNRQPYTS